MKAFFKPVWLWKFWGRERRSNQSRSRKDEVMKYLNENMVNVLFETRNQRSSQPYSLKSRRSKPSLQNLSSRNSNASITNSQVLPSNHVRLIIHSTRLSRTTFRIMTLETHHRSDENTRIADMFRQRFFRAIGLMGVLLCKLPETSLTSDMASRRGRVESRL